MRVKKQLRFKTGVKTQLPHFSIVQYAHDTLIIMEGCSSQHMELKQILQIFAMWSGLMVNYSKSVMVPINDSEDHMTSLAADFGCSIGSLPFYILGYATGSS